MTALLLIRSSRRLGAFPDLRQSGPILKPSDANNSRSWSPHLRSRHQIAVRRWRRSAVGVPPSGPTTPSGVDVATP